MDNKKGLSAVVTTLIIILLVLVAVGVIWVVIKNIISGGAEEIFLGKFTVDLKIKNVNLDNSTNNVSLRIKRNPGAGDLSGIKFIFNDGVNSEVFEEMDLTLEELGERGFNFALSQLNINDVLTISIAPIYTTDSGKKIVGRVISTYKVKEGGYCIANCTGKVCGSNDCGGTCLPGCDDGYYCQDGTQCVEGIPPCELTSASWSDASVIEGTTVTLNVAGTSCAGIDLNYTIYENDFAGDDLLTSFVSTSLNPTWVSEWIDDGVGDPEYYFVVTVVDNPSETITSSDPELAVTQAGLTCTDAGGTCMTNPCDTYTDCTSLVGTCVTGTCCSGTCSTPIGSYVIRSFSSSTVSAGSSIDVMLDVYVNTSLDWLFIVYEEVDVASGWTVIDAGGGIISGDPNLGWTVVSSAFPLNPEYNILYTLQAPPTPGIYNVAGSYSFSNSTVNSVGDIVLVDILGQTTVTVI